MTARTWVGGIALAALAILGVAMAAAGPDASPAEGYEGAYGGGLGIDGGAYIHLERAALLAYAVVIACATALPRRLIWAASGLLVLAFAIPSAAVAGPVQLRLLRAARRARRPQPL